MTAPSTTDLHIQETVAEKKKKSSNQGAKTQEKLGLCASLVVNGGCEEKAHKQQQKCKESFFFTWFSTRMSKLEYTSATTPATFGSGAGRVEGQ